MFQVLFSNPSARGFAALYGGTFLSGAWAIIIPTIPVLAGEFGVSAGGAAQIVTATAIGKFFGTIAAGILLDRIGTRLALVGAPLVGCIAALLCALVPWFSVFLILSLCIGAADSLGATAREFAALDLTRRNQRGRLISSMHGTHNIGAALAPFAGGWLTELFSFKAAFLGYAILCGLMALLGVAGPNLAAPAQQMMPQRARDWGAAGLKSRLHGLSALFREIRPDLRNTFVALVLATMVSQSQRIVVQSMLPLYAGAYLDLAPSEIGMLFTISGIVVFAMIIPAGFIMDRVGRKWCTVPSTGVPALVFLLIPLTDSFSQLAILVGIAGFAQGLSLGSLATSTYDVVPAHARGRLQALRRTIAELGSGVAPLIGGYLANQFNPGVPFLVYAPLLLFSASWLAIVGKETLKR
jgi:DHA1 family bicyclomycin/chloramphenicol resistance-like MFS transporter